MFTNSRGERFVTYRGRTVDAGVRGDEFAEWCAAVCGLEAAESAAKVKTALKSLSAAVDPAVSVQVLQEGVELSLGEALEMSAMLNAVRDALAVAGVDSTPQKQVEPRRWEPPVQAGVAPQFPAGGTRDTAWVYAEVKHYLKELEQYEREKGRETVADRIAHFDLKLKPKEEEEWGESEAGSPVVTVKVPLTVKEKKGLLGDMQTQGKMAKGQKLIFEDLIDDEDPEGILTRMVKEVKEIHVATRKGLLKKKVFKVGRSAHKGVLAYDLEAWVKDARELARLDLSMAWDGEENQRYVAALEQMVAGVTNAAGKPQLEKLLESKVNEGVEGTHSVAELHTLLLSHASKWRNQEPGPNQQKLSEE